MKEKNEIEQIKKHEHERPVEEKSDVTMEDDSSDLAFLGKIRKENLLNPFKFRGTSH